jgi:hypothetical protein
LLFALETRFRLCDIHRVAATSLAAGLHDNLCQLLYTSRDTRLVVIGQDRKIINSLTGDDAGLPGSLITIGRWLFSSPETSLPARLAGLAKEVRAALYRREINSLEVWLWGSPSPGDADHFPRAENELLLLVQDQYPDCELENIRVMAVDWPMVQGWYDALDQPVLVTDQLEVDISAWYEMTGEGWQALVTSVPARWWHQLWLVYQRRLVSPLVTDCLRVTRRNDLVPQDVSTAATQTPSLFWLFNQGVTAETTDYRVRPLEGHDSGRGRLQLDGLAIIDGAQTVEALGALPAPPGATARVQLQLVRSTNTNLMKKIGQYRNMQHTVRRPDFRFDDTTQRRLIREFRAIPDIHYQGSRAGPAIDLKDRPPHLASTDTCGVALVAFHQDPALAHHEPQELWCNEQVYLDFFSEDTRAVHLLFVYALLRAVERVKAQLAHREQQGRARQAGPLALFRQGGTDLLFLAAVGRSMDVLAGRPTPNLFHLSFGPVSPRQAIDHWLPVVTDLLPLTFTLEQAAATELRVQEVIREGVNKFHAATILHCPNHKSLYRAFADQVRYGTR